MVYTAPIALSSTALGLAGVILYVRYLHQSFRSQIRHCALDSGRRRSAFETGEIDTLPKQLLDHPEDYRIVHDRDEIQLPNPKIFKSENAEELFTKLTRRNMVAFSNLPQSWIMRTMAKTAEQRKSFEKSHLLEIDYREGDLVCGFYRVIKRSPFKVEIDMEPPPGAGPLSGRLIISLKRKDDEAFIRTETLQWIDKDSKLALPLERPPIRFMHELASFWLLVSGRDYLESLISA